MIAVDEVEFYNSKGVLFKKESKSSFQLKPYFML